MKIVQCIHIENLVRPKHRLKLPQTVQILTIVWVFNILYPLRNAPSWHRQRRPASHFLMNKRNRTSIHYHWHYKVESLLIKNLLPCDLVKNDYSHWGHISFEFGIFDLWFEFDHEGLRNMLISFDFVFSD